jgi:glucose/arabinose dehydrogenase
VTPVDIAVGADGTIYVAELFASQISTISNGVVSPYMPLDTPGAIEIDRDGTLYATTGVFGIGSVVKLTS